MSKKIKPRQQRKPRNYIVRDMIIEKRAKQMKPANQRRELEKDWIKRAFQDDED